MKKVSGVEQLRILAILSDQIWQDYECGIINEIEYCKRITLIREEINSHIVLPFSEISRIVAKAGYLLIENKNSFGKVTDFIITNN